MMAKQPPGRVFFWPSDFDKIRDVIGNETDTGDVAEHIHDIRGDLVGKLVAVPTPPAGNANFDELVRWLDTRTRERVERGRDIGRDAMYKDAQKHFGPVTHKELADARAELPKDHPAHKLGRRRGS